MYTCGFVIAKLQQKNLNRRKSMTIMEYEKENDCTTSIVSCHA